MCYKVFINFELGHRYLHLSISSDFDVVGLEHRVQERTFPNCLEHCQWDGVGFGLIVIITIGGLAETVQTAKVAAAAIPSIGCWTIGRTIEMPSPY